MHNITFEVLTAVLGKEKSDEIFLDKTFVKKHINKYPNSFFKTTNIKYLLIREICKLKDLGNGEFKGNLYLSEIGNPTLLKNLQELETIKILNGDLYISNNSLTSLKGCPEKISGSFNCENNMLTSLEGGPKIVGEDYEANSNQLTSLKGSPEDVNGDFHCNHNKLTSLEGSPVWVGGDFYCEDNLLTSLEGHPKYLEGDLYCASNKIKSLENLPKSIKQKIVN